MVTLFWILVTVWVIWLVGYPIYMKIKREDMFDYRYAIVVNALAVLINLVNILRKVI